jgi:KTSC domain
MRRERVTSSMIAAIGHDKDRVLEIEFVSGGIYRYLGVARRTFEKFKKASSKGSFFLEEIKDVYPHVRMR